ncbi:MAG TPA: hypothetical protein PLD84_07060 [Chitinophagales bacterium]|nr:hypothetical protein [Chitinophagales bacterium]
MKKNNDNNDPNNKSIQNDRKVPNEIEPPMPKPKRSDDDNDFTKGDKNDPLRKEPIERPSQTPIREEGEDDGQGHIHEPVAEGDGDNNINADSNEVADESAAKTTDVQPKQL